MKCVLLVLALVCGIQATIIPQVKDLHIQKLEGKWNTMLMAATYAPLLNNSSTYKVFIKNMKVTTQKDMEITLSKQVNQNCEESHIVALKTQDPAVFMVDFEGKQKVTVLDTDYDHYAVFCMEVPKDDVQKYNVCQYMTRTMNPKEGEMMVNFAKILKNMPQQPQIILNMVQMKEHCRV
ncbi:beta-lactoglobulin-2-like [Suncus etruscus]|uniref:beta-lactoglobulin-2-like n=1 Tax=Suncus etruscus TaxID=109475 RepID=UPI0021102922|nr:beta-lactoglobulin-2-like [Suncus etruscus]